MSKFIATLTRKIAVTGGDVIDDFVFHNQDYHNSLVSENFDLEYFINDNGSYGEIHGTYIGTTDFNEWILTEEVRTSMMYYEQPRLDFMKDKIEVTRYLDWDDTGVSVDWKSYSEFTPSTELTFKV